MNYVIICASVWFLYTSENQAVTDLNTYTEAAEQLECDSRVNIVDNEKVAYFRSEEFGKAFSIVPLSAFNHDENVKLDNLPAPEPTPGAGPTPEPSVTPDTTDKHCHYDIILVKKGVYKLIGGCQ
jgi:hypothetical protein